MRVVPNDCHARHGPTGLCKRLSKIRTVTGSSFASRRCPESLKSVGHTSPTAVQPSVEHLSDVRDVRVGPWCTAWSAVHGLVALHGVSTLVGGQQVASVAKASPSLKLSLFQTTQVDFRARFFAFPEPHFKGGCAGSFENLGTDISQEVDRHVLGGGIGF